MSLSAKDVARLRGKTGAGMVDCKRALEEADGDLAKAEDALRKQHKAKGAIKSDREASEGAVVAAISEDGSVGILLEVLCETDFVAKAEPFQEFLCGVTGHALALEGDWDCEKFLDSSYKGDTVRAAMEELRGSTGENILFTRAERHSVEPGTGRFGAYIHKSEGLSRIAVLAELSCEKSESASDDSVSSLAKDICLQIAGMSPAVINRDDLSAEVVDREKAIHADSGAGKPPEIAIKIIEGKLKKFLYAKSVLLDQPFVKEDGISVGDHVANVSKSVGDTITVQKMVRCQLGDSSVAE